MRFSISDTDKVIIILGEFCMEKKYRVWYKIQVISCICFAFFIICLIFMMYADLSNVPIIITAVIATASQITTITSGVVRAYIGHKMGIISTKRDWIIISIALLLYITYIVIRNL